MRVFLTFLAAYTLSQFYRSFLAVIAPEVTPELALATIESLSVLGALHASPAVKAALADRIL